MGYLYCGDCQSFFEEDEIVTRGSWSHSDYIGYGGGMYEESYHCPRCGSEEISEAETCRVCGEPTLEEDMNDGICKWCEEDFTSEMDEYLFKYTKKHGCEDDAFLDLLGIYLDKQ